MVSYKSGVKIFLELGLFGGGGGGRSGELKGEGESYNIILYRQEGG